MSTFASPRNSIVLDMLARLNLAAEVAAYTYILGLWKAKARTFSFATLYGETDWKNDDLERLLAALGVVGVNWSGRMA